VIEFWNPSLPQRARKAGAPGSIPRPERLRMLRLTTNHSQPRTRKLLPTPANGRSLTEPPLTKNSCQNSELHRNPIWSRLKPPTFGRRENGNQSVALVR
jgi:hypothetical protein